MNKISKTKRALIGAASIIAVAAASGAAAAQDAPTDFNIEEQALSKALLDFSEQSGMPVAAPIALVDGKVAPAVSGEMAPEQALAELLSGSGLEYQATPSGGAYTVVLAVAEEEEVSEPAPFRVAEQVSEESAVEQVEDRGDEDEVAVQDLIVVTGTNIRGVKQEFSPLFTYSRDEFDNAGFSSVADMVSALPQNFGGGPSLDTSAGTGSGAGATAINLRGLGAEATLTLLNGRRMAPGGLVGAAVDISALPVSALERVDVLTDGASAIYGSDAIAGVVNFVLRDDYSGHESRARIGSITEGDGDSLQLAHTVGVSGRHGHALLSYEFSSDDALDAGSKSFTSVAPDPTEILPDTERHSAVFSGGVRLNDAIEAFSDLYYNQRESAQVTASSTSSVVDSAEVEVEQYGGTLGIELTLGESWSGQVSTSYSRSAHFNRVSRAPAFAAFAGLIDDVVTDSVSADALISGPVFDLGGGALQAVVGAQYRRETHDGFSDSFGEDGSLLGVVQAAADTKRKVYAAFGEIYAPIIGRQNSLPGMQKLSVNVAGRFEHYSDFGSTFNPKVGVVWSPANGLSFRSTYSKSFRAPRLQQLVDEVNNVILADYIDPGVPEGISAALIVNGFSTQLDAERSEAWTAGIDFEPSGLRGLRMSGTFYEIDYTGRIASPFALLDPATLSYFDFPVPVTRDVSLSDLQLLVDQSSLPLFNFTHFLPTGSMSELSDVSVLVDQRPTNTASSLVRGVDATLSYDIRLPKSDLSVFVHGSYLIDSEDQFSSLRPVVQKVDTIFNPVDLRFRAGANFSSRGVGATVAANFVDDYQDNQAIGVVRRVENWLTVDASLQFELEEYFSNDWASGAKIVISSRNLLDTPPPKLTQSIAIGADVRPTLYDPANADPHGRTVALQITKSW